MEGSNKQTVVGQTPQGNTAMGEHEWAISIWDCCTPMDLCCISCWCPCILYGKTHHRLEDPSMTNYKSVNESCMKQGCLQIAGLAWLLPMIERAGIRRRFGLKGSGFDDFIRAFCLGGMVLLQHEKEVMLLTKDGAQQPNTQGYQSQPAMSYTA